MFFVRIRPAQSQAALRARHLDLEMTRDDMSRNVPALHRHSALPPCTCDGMAVACERVPVPKVARDALSIALDKRPAPRPTACPQTLKRGRV